MELAVFGLIVLGVVIVCLVCGVFKSSPTITSTGDSSDYRPRDYRPSSSSQSETTLPNYKMSEYERNIDYNDPKYDPNPQIF